MNRKIKEFVKGMQEGESKLHLAVNVANNEGVIGDEEELELHKFIKKIIKIATKVKVEELRDLLYPSIDDFIEEVEKALEEDYEKEQEKIRKELEETKLNSPYSYEYKYDVDKGTLFDE